MACYPKSEILFNNVEHEFLEANFLKVSGLRYGPLFQTHL